MVSFALGGPDSPNPNVDTGIAYGGDRDYLTELLNYEMYGGPPPGGNAAAPPPGGGAPPPGGGGGAPPPVGGGSGPPEQQPEQQMGARGATQQSAVPPHTSTPYGFWADTRGTPGGRAFVGSGHTYVEFGPDGYVSKILAAPTGSGTQSPSGGNYREQGGLPFDPYSYGSSTATAGPLSAAGAAAPAATSPLAPPPGQSAEGWARLSPEQQVALSRYSSGGAPPQAGQETAPNQFDQYAIGGAGGGYVGSYGDTPGAGKMSTSAATPTDPRMGITPVEGGRPAPTVVPFRPPADSTPKPWPPDQGIPGTPGAGIDTSGLTKPPKPGDGTEPPVGPPTGPPGPGDGTGNPPFGPPPIPNDKVPKPGDLFAGGSSGARRLTAQAAYDQLFRTLQNPGYTPEEKSAMVQEAMNATRSRYAGAQGQIARHAATTGNRAGYAAGISQLARGEAGAIGQQARLNQIDFGKEAQRQREWGTQGMGQMYGAETSYLSNLFGQRGQQASTPLGTGIRQRKGGEGGTTDYLNPTTPYWGRVGDEPRR